jgi:hypothetical protein
MEIDKSASNLIHSRHALLTHINALMGVCFACKAIPKSCGGDKEVEIEKGKREME